jgi:rare lipoprotein A
MRRFLLVFLGGLLLNTAVFAQVNSPVQIGRATQELQYGGLNAAHPDIPLGSRVKIANTETGQEIEVTIIGRIPRSSIRIVDLSPGAWRALGLTADTDVRLVPPSTPAGGSSEANGAPFTDDQETGQWSAVQVHPDESPDIEENAAENIAENSTQNATQKAAESAGNENYAALVLTHTPIKVVPGLPNPNSRKIYRLQVGAYARKENADFAECTLKAAGFETRREARGSLTRVLAVGISAADVKSAVQAIESAGFGEVWIRE